MVAKYDVFINHRGPDVKETFVSHLYAALDRNGFRPFVDAESIPQGRHALGSINEALRGASVHVAIFSKGYAESPYCLDELCDMLETGKVIFPVFYDVEPADLRRFEVKRPFAVAFENHRERGRDERIEKWKKALHDVSNMMGRIIQKDNVNRNEHLLLKRIVLSVKREMPSKMLPSKRRFGLKESLREVLSMHDTMADDVSMVGLCGMGGIGKTTLAVETYNQCVSCKQYEHHCFLKDVRSNQALGLQKLLLKELTRNDSEIRTNEDYLLGLNALRCKRVLLVIDDIDKVSQFESLIPDIQGLGSGSCIVITSRDEDVLERAMRTAVRKNVYKVNVLSSSDSRQLFNWHAFLSETANEEFGDLAVTIADACGGLPLALEVMGAMLCMKEDPDNRGIWEEAVQILRGNETIFGKLRISYDRLNEGEKSMFRDIACSSMMGLDKDVAMTIWKSCEQCSRRYCLTSTTPFKALRTLRDRSLVKVESGRLSMHDVLRDMGRDIVTRMARESPGEGTHLWDATTVLRVLRNKEAIGVRGINLFRNGSKDTVPCKASDFACMKELHILDLDGFGIEPDDFSKWSQALRFLRWRSTFRDGGIPRDLKLSNLAVLDISRNYQLKRLREDDATMENPALRMLFLDGCSQLITLPDNFGSSLSGLQTLTMSWCCTIERLPESVVRLSNLKKLDMSDSRSLRELPKKFGSLISLQNLNLQGCISLSELPASFGSLLNLKDLDLQRCTGLSELPASFGSLVSLQNLNLGGCRGLSKLKLPACFGSLLNLKDLELHWCTSLSELPASFGSLLNLKDLNLQGCTRILWELTQLEGFEPTRVQGFVRIARILKELSQPAIFEPTVVHWFVKIARILWELSQLKDFDLHWCTNLSKLPASFGCLKMLKRLIMDLSGVQVLPMNFGELSCHDFLSFWMLFRELQSLTPLQVETRHLDLGGRLISLLEAFELLIDLRLPYHETVTSLPRSIGSLKFLVRLDIYMCPNLQIIQALPLSLHHPDLSGCRKLTRIASFGEMRLLVFLNLADCTSLRHVNGLERLEALQVVNLRDCKSIEDRMVLGSVEIDYYYPN